MGDRHYRLKVLPFAIDTELQMLSFDVLLGRQAGAHFSRSELERLTGFDFTGAVSSKTAASTAKAR